MMGLSEEFPLFPSGRERYAPFDSPRGSPLPDERQEEIPEFINQLLDDDQPTHSSFTAPQTPNTNAEQKELVFTKRETMTPYRDNRHASTSFVPKTQRFLHVKPGDQVQQQFGTFQSYTDVGDMTKMENIDDNEFLKMCCDQFGCRCLQKKLEDDDDDAIDEIYERMLPIMNNLIADQFGNYLCQKLIEVVDDEQRLDILKCVSNNIGIISKNIHGTRSVQKMINCATTKAEIDELILSLSPHIVDLVFDGNGNHVIQECLKTFSKEQNKFIFDGILGDSFVEICEHKHGCCVVQRCIDFGNRGQLNKLVDKVISNTLEIITDPYGNYVVQYILKVDVDHVCMDVTKIILDDLIVLSTQKFSSNVIEQLVMSDEVGVKELMFDKFLQYKDVERLLQGSFSNYVIQTCLENSSREYHVKLSNWILPHIDSIKNISYYKKIQTKLLFEPKSSHFM
ncbi:hypothetical protein EIN_430600 [Entamoeba invadens IP1]|uniref:PUM-HD domain-containing protein n=1 Tax=Entamoeba invadens IP1 TaxID=370355 RepID=A0A0A1UGX7_ENTIV|nr:hypothetical protein EIN_430600 [Entamoeba invadens IP1]ELP95254.1 hypothetical protein EIN_430600 [Entamoeba invadens IP1]|eukprot:XP_004262025.1 hypothetical protein EIN_430600 [Entamoeba invadens IP1]